MRQIRLPEFRRLWNDNRGFTLAELLVLVAVIGIITAVSAPALVTYWRSATLKAGARELAATLNMGRSVAVSQNTSVCVKQSANKVQFVKDVTGACLGGTVWTGPGTDGGGWFRLQNSVRVISNPQVVFNYLGAATTAGTYTVQNPVNNATMSVTVSLSGRVTTGP
jgi:prepilin-type N-terminal cleavage/methylation domain-containing protein